MVPDRLGAEVELGGDLLGRAALLEQAKHLDLAGGEMRGRWCGARVIGALLERQATRAITVAGWLFVVGTTLFSGSLYLLVLTGQHLWGAVTPFGGALLMTGWLCLAVGFARRS